MSFLRWPEPGVLPKVRLSDLPVGAEILGLAPVGRRWTAVMTKSGIKPAPGCPAAEFLPCFASYGGNVVEVG